MAMKQSSTRMMICLRKRNIFILSTCMMTKWMKSWVLSDVPVADTVLRAKSNAPFALYFQIEQQKEISSGFILLHVSSHRR
jgi:hypothetical protein